MALHTDHAFIENLFFQQMKRLSLDTRNSFELQFSDAWLVG